MSEKLEARKVQEPRILTASEIRTRVEDIAEELALKMRAGQPDKNDRCLEAYPLDTRKFIMLMSDFVRMN